MWENYRIKHYNLIFVPIFYASAPSIFPRRHVFELVAANDTNGAISVKNTGVNLGKFPRLVL